jgi:2-methylcitrate dehydratase PrpD
LSFLLAAAALVPVSPIATPKAAAPASPAFKAITGVESETDDYPLGERRNSYSAELLAKLDSEVSSYLNEVRPAVLQSCREIIEEVEALDMSASGEWVQ